MTSASCRSPLLIVAILLVGCGPPDQHTLQLCREAARAQARDHQLEASDEGEVIEARMLTKHYALKETENNCGDDFASATNARCYYRDTYISRILTDF
jgi:hypothetical protein